MPFSFFLFLLCCYECRRLVAELNSIDLLDGTTTTCRELDVWRQLVALANDSGMHRYLLTADIYSCVLNCLVNCSSNIDNDEKNACLLVLINRMMTKGVCGREQRLEFLTDERLCQFYIHLLEQYSGSKGVIKYAVWMPYLQSASGVGGLAPRPINVEFVRVLCDKITADIPASVLDIPASSQDTVAHVLIECMSTTVLDVQVVLEAVLKALLCIVKVAQRRIDALGHFFPAAVNVLGRYSDAVSIHYYLINIILHMEVDTLAAVCREPAAIPFSEFLKIAVLYETQNPLLSASSFRVVLRLCFFAECAKVVVCNSSLCELVLEGVRARLHDADIVNDAATALRMLMVISSGGPQELLSLSILEEMLEEHCTNAAVLPPLLSAIALVMSVPLADGGFFHELAQKFDELRVSLGDAATLLPQHATVERFCNGAFDNIMIGYIACCSSQPPPFTLSTSVLEVMHVIAAHATPLMKQALLSHCLLKDVVRILFRELEPSRGDYWHRHLTFMITDILSNAHVMSVALGAGWVELLLEIGDAKIGSPPVPLATVTCCLEALGRLSVVCGKEKTRMIDAGVHHYYVRQMLHAPCYMVAFRACQSMCVLVNSSIKHALIDADAARGLMNVLRCHPGNTVILRIALLCFAGLSLTDKAYKEKLIDQGVHTVVHSILSRPEFPTMIHTLAVVVLLRLLMDDGDANDVAVMPGLQESILKVMGSHSLLEMDSNTSDLLQCGHSLLANVFCSTVWSRLMSYDLSRRGVFAYQLSVHGSALLKYLNLDHAHVSAPFERHSQPLVSSRLSGVALHICPNCRSGLATEMILTFPHLSPIDYEDLAERGWFRRGGVQFFQFRSNHASACNTGEIRVRVPEFDGTSSRAYARVRRRCAAAGVQTKIIKPEFQRESFDLYYKYQMERHESEYCSEQSYRSHLLLSPLKYEMATNGIVEYGTFHHQYWVGDHLAGVSVVDVMPHSFNSIYMFFDVDKKYSRLSLGVYSALKELELAQELNRRGADIRHYYLGNFCPTNRKLVYKSDYQPAEVLCAHISPEWQLHSKTSPCTLFSPGLPHNPLQDRMLKQAIDQGLAETKVRQVPGAAGVQSVHCLPAARQKLVNNISSPHLRYLIGYPDREKCNPMISRLRVAVDGKEMSFGLMLLTYYVHPQCIGQLCWTIEELLDGLGAQLFEKLVLHFSLFSGNAMVEPSSSDLALA